jgi:hypothetical protein
MHPKTGARFRGSLVDDKMYAIDTNEWGLDDILSEYRARAAYLQDGDCSGDSCRCDETSL